MSSGMNMAEAEEIAKKMTYRDAVYNALQGKCIPFKKATKIKLNELLENLDKGLTVTEFADNKWIPCSERLPSIGEDVLVCDINGHIYVNYLHTDTCLNKWGYDAFGDKIKNIIAWMPLPTPFEPQESEN